MSKKQKIRKKIVVPERTSEKSTQPVPATAKVSAAPRTDLILFDRKTKVFLLLLLLTSLFWPGEIGIGDRRETKVYKNG
jgi:hypothetical protein